jgi:ribonuclease P protein component
MLAKTHRLRRRGDFAATIRAGRRARGGTLVVHLSEGGGDDVPVRAGFVVSRAVGGAVARNRVRRRLRHLVRGHLGELPTGTRLVVRALPAAATVTYHHLAGDFAAALRAARRRGEPR